jgi:hypothetical protein
MLRLCVALLLLFTLAPRSVAAGEEASAQNRISAVHAEQAAGPALQAKTELLQSWLVRGGEGLPPGVSTSSLGGPASGIRILPSTGCLVRPATPHRVDPVAPHCERLPYDATAPPAR